MLDNKLLRVDNNNKDQNLFRFEYCWPAFVGRNEEMQRLFNFVNYENENLLWWAVTGKGGTGKSRLALELCRELEKQGWYTGFLPNTNTSNVWREWAPQKSTLIVVDYTHEKVKELGEHIGNKYQDSKQWSYPVRILFLERGKESKILTDFCHPNSEVIKNHIRYREDSDTLELEGLGDKFVDSIIAGVFGRYRRKKTSVNEIKMIKSFLKGKGHENRPLYAMFIADACARGEDVRGWNTEKLHESVLDHNMNIWKRAGIDEDNDLDKKHINLLTLATLTNGLNIEDGKFAKYLKVTTIDGLSAVDILPVKHKFCESKYRILCDNEVHEELSPMAPDILGEYFVLQRWKSGTSETCQMKLMTWIAWQYKPEELVDFITRASMDFQADEWVDNVIRLAGTSGWYSVEILRLLVNLTATCCNSMKIDKAVEYYNYIEGLFNEEHQQKEDISPYLFTAAYNLTCGFTKAGELDTAAQYYERLRDLCDSGLLEDKECLQKIVNAGYNLTHFYANEGALSKAAQYFDHVKELWDNGNQQDYELTLKLSNAAFALTTGYSDTNEFNKALKYYDLIDNLWNQRYRQDKDITLSLAKATSQLVCNRLNAGELDKAVKYYDRFETLWAKGFQKDEEFSSKLAYLAVLFSVAFNNKGKVKASERFTKKFTELYESFPENKEIKALCIEYFVEKRTD